jgi:hypothetical protein
LSSGHHGRVLDSRNQQPTRLELARCAQQRQMDRFGRSRTEMDGISDGAQATAQLQP